MPESTLDIAPRSRDGSSSPDNSDRSVFENADPLLLERVCNIEKKSNDHGIEIVLLKAALADAINRLYTVEAQLKQAKTEDQKKKKDVPITDGTAVRKTRKKSVPEPPGNQQEETLNNDKNARNRKISNYATVKQPASRRRSRITSESEREKSETEDNDTIGTALESSTTNSIGVSESQSQNLRKNLAPPSSAAKKKFWSRSQSIEEKSANNKSKESLKENNENKDDDGKPKIILQKKMSLAARRRRGMSLNGIDEINKRANKDEPIKFNTRGRAMTLYPPSDYQEDISDGAAPEQKLKLGWVYGYRGKDCRDNLFFLYSGEIVYNMAGVIILYDVNTNAQRHYTQHTDDVKCIAIHPNKRYVASGQVAGHGEDRKPHVLVWDSSTLETLMSFGQGIFERGLCAVEFSTYENGKFLIAFDESNDHVIYVYEWEKGIKMTETKVSKEVVFGAKWNPKSELSFATYGKSHLMFWNICIEQKGIYLSKKAAIYEKISKPKYVQSIVYTNTGDLVSGDSNGNILLFKDENNRNRISESALSAHKGGVFCLCFLAEKETILSSGKDGQFAMWSLTLEKLSDFCKIPEQYGPSRTILYDNVDDTFMTGTAKNCILQYDPELSTENVLVLGHFDEMWGVAAHSTKLVFASCAHEQLVCVWDCENKQNLWNYYIEEQGQCAEFHPFENYLLVGTKSGTIYFLNYVTKEEEITIQISRDNINDIKISPDGKAFAVGCRDNIIYLYTWPEDITALKKPKMLQAHTSKVMHIDWSLDSQYLQSNSSDYELLLWSTEAGLQVLTPAALRDVIWATWTCPFGFAAMGIWTEGVDGTDINACARSHDRKLLATADTSGEVKIFRYPCVKLKSENNVGVGHSSHVTCVRFLANDYGLVSVGGKDCSVMQWILI